MGVPIKTEGKPLSFYYGDEKICFLRTKREHTSDKVQIKVYPDCRVVVSAPADASNDAVLKAVKARSRWVHKQLREFRKQLANITPRQYVSGESHYYLGKQHLLKVVSANDQITGVKLLRGKLEVATNSKDREKLRTLLGDWYKARARDIFSNRLDALLEKTLWISDRPSIRVLTMQTQWGSCSPNGLITLNPHLVKAPRECIDYVILHELCHIAEHNHSVRFYRLLNQVMPGWEKTKMQLDDMSHRILQI